MSRDLDRGSRFMAWVAVTAAFLPEPTVSKGAAGIAATFAAGMYFFSGEASAWADDPPDGQYTTVAAPVVHLARPMVAGPGVTSAEASALNALMGNIAWGAAYTGAMTTAANRATGAAGAGSSTWLERQDGAITQDATRLAGLVRAQPALSVRLQQAVTDAGVQITVSPADLGQMQQTSQFRRVEQAMIATLTQLGVPAPSADRMAADLLRPTRMSAISFPDVLTNPQLAKDAMRSAAGLEQFAAALCSAPVSGTPTPPAPQAGSFALTSTSVTNPNAPELTIDATGGTAIWDHPRDGGKWKVEFTFKVPRTLTPGQSFSITLGIKVDNQEPNNPNSYGIGARAPDFANALNITAPATMQASKTFTVPFSASYGPPSSIKDAYVVIGMVSAEVTYTYHRP